MERPSPPPALLALVVLSVLAVTLIFLILNAPPDIVMVFATG